MDSTESEHLENIQSWWTRYQFYVVGSILMLLAAIGGFTYTNTYFAAEKVSSNELLFGIIQQATSEQDLTAATELYRTIESQGDFPELTELSAFALASVQIAAQDYAAAATVLLQTHRNSDDVYVRAASGLRAAEVLMLADDYEQALAVLEAMDEESPLQNLINERRGDIEFIRGNHTEALEFYTAAVQASNRSGASFYLPMLQIKLSALLSEMRHDVALPEADDADSEEQTDDSANDPANEEQDESDEATGGEPSEAS